MFAQKTFEGETYVTISMVPYVLYRIRSLLLEAMNTPNISIQVANLIQKMTNAFELHWGCGEPGTVSREYQTEGPNRRPRGIPLITLLASLLDPRFKIGPGLAQEDKDYLWIVILHQMIGIERTVRATRAAGEQEQVQQPVEGLQREDELQNGHANDDVFDDMFNDLNTMRMAETQAVHIGREEQGVPGNPYETAHAELTLYKAEPMLPLQKEDRTYNNPLDWWCLKAQQFPLLSKLAIRYLCIPATSAPSERVFSTAGLTIAKERSRLDPATANELVFLHETVPALR